MSRGSRKINEIACDFERRRGETKPSEAVRLAQESARRQARADKNKYLSYYKR